MHRSSRPIPAIALLCLAWSGSAAPQARNASSTPGIARMNLEADWTLQSSAVISGKGEAISSNGFDVRAWYPVTVPSTVIGALVANKVYPDPYFGMNLRSIPGTDV